MVLIFKLYPDVVIVLVFVLNVIVNRGVVCDVDPTGTTPAVLAEYCLNGPAPEPKMCKE